MGYSITSFNKFYKTKNNIYSEIKKEDNVNVVTFFLLTIEAMFLRFFYQCFSFVYIF